MGLGEIDAGGGCDRRGPEGVAQAELARLDRDLEVAALHGALEPHPGQDPQQWRTRVPTYARVRYEGLYPGIDLKQSTRDWHTHAAALPCSAVAIRSTAAVTAGS